ncbi:MAG: ATP-binding cassette domain-containing protein [Nitrososphaeria archaeon]|nr:ATP-binding cassette domain-containing protein [Nitrososphaeria archaeon]NIN52350.1 ATP-binding cassette domain-containing protein [Nitrososphaeria archaeon]NIQ32828.1 ATP-binding cassette domain-containing protein [Nitrososphaeria archaeon]
MRESLLKVENVKLSYSSEYGSVRAVDGVSFDIAEKEVIGLIGESGCGKSSVALAIMGLNPGARIEEGKILFQGKDLLKLSKKEMQKIRGNSISMIFQDPMTYLNPVMRVGDQIIEILITQDPSLKKEEARARTIETLTQVRLTEKVLDYYPFELSGGMLQRIMIAMMLAPKPQMVIADEPTTALDVTIQLQILNLLNSLQKSEGISLLLITHDLGIVAEICDRVYMMYAGKIVENADVYTIYERPKHPYTAGLIGSVLTIDEYKEELPTLSGDVPDLTDLPSGCRFHPRCEYAKDICYKEEPPLIEIDPGHQVLCWLYK